MPPKITKKEAKIASDAAGARVHLTSRVCEHCGLALASNQITAVKRITIGPRGKANTRMAFYAKGHQA